MQQEGRFSGDDFGNPDGAARPAPEARLGRDAPYANYALGAAYDEMFSADGQVRPYCSALHARLATLPPEELIRRQQACEQSFLQQGITFTVYSDKQATERIIPTDLLPRIVTAGEWERIEAGLTQRIRALNLFLRDIYTDGRVLKDGVMPRPMIYGSKHYRREMRGPAGSARRLCQCLRQRTSIRRRRRRIRRAGRQSARAVRRLLHAGQPRGGAARISRRVPRRGRAADRALSPGAARDPANPSRRSRRMSRSRC